MYWLGRYLERAHSLAQALKAYEALTLDMPRPSSSVDYAPMGALSGFDPKMHTGRLGLASLLLDETNPSTVLGALQAARENLRQSRPSVPIEAWETLNGLYLDLGSLPDREPGTLSLALADAVAGSRELQGTISVEMLRDSTLGFLSMGIHLERADMVLRTLVVLSNALGLWGNQHAFDDVRLSGLLRAVAAHTMYRRRHRMKTNLETVLDFVLLDREFPRSIDYCLSRLDARLRVLPDPNGPLKCVAEARPDPSAVRAATTSAGLTAFAEGQLERLARVNGALGAKYFASAA